MKCIVCGKTAVYVYRGNSYCVTHYKKQVKIQRCSDAIVIEAKYEL